jgi:hypothetical protein
MTHIPAKIRTQPDLFCLWERTIRGIELNCQYFQLEEVAVSEDREQMTEDRGQMTEDRA